MYALRLSRQVRLAVSITDNAVVLALAMPWNTRAGYLEVNKVVDRTRQEALSASNRGREKPIFADCNANSSPARVLLSGIVRARETDASLQEVHSFAGPYVRDARFGTAGRELKRSRICQRHPLIKTRSELRRS